MTVSRLMMSSSGCTYSENDSGPSSCHGPQTHDACLIPADQTSDRDVRIKRELLCYNVRGDFFHIKTQEPLGVLHLVPDGDLRNMADVFAEGDSVSRCLFNHGQSRNDIADVRILSSCT